METWVRLGSSILEGDACVAPTQICPLQGRYGVRGRFMGGVFFFSVAIEDRPSCAQNLRIRNSHLTDIRGR